MTDKKQVKKAIKTDTNSETQAETNLESLIMTKDSKNETKSATNSETQAETSKSSKLSKEEKKALRRNMQITGGRLFIPESMKKPGRVYRWVNVTPGNVENWKNRGAEITTHSVTSGDGSLTNPELNGSPMEVEVGSSNGSLKAVLMDMSVEDYEIMKELEQEKTDMRTQMMYKGKDPTTGKSVLPSENLIGSISKENFKK